jgi:two-component system sensor histidine kinase MtrB
VVIGAVRHALTHPRVPGWVIVAPRAVRRIWRRSLQVRVVATTLVVSGAAVLGLGLVLVDRIGAGLVDAKRRAAVSETESGQAYARQQLQALRGPNDPGLDQTLFLVGLNLSSRTGRVGAFDVVILPADRDTSIVYASKAVREDIQMPADLVHAVTADSALAYQFANMAPEGGPARPHLVVGAPVETVSGTFQIYYLFPLDAEVATSGMVERTLIATGLVLVLLVVGVAAIVTRQVVTPVRLAAKTAGRLAAGLLEERMTVRGEDDLARLATSFNQMATNLQRQIVQLESLSLLQRRFTSDVSHELRTPLTTVRMAADVLHAERSSFDPQVRRAAELLQIEVDRFETLLSDLLEISRYDAGVAALEPEATDIGGLIRRTADALEALAGRAGCEIILDLPSTPAIAEVDPRRVERILRNLLGNAVEHSEGKPIRITLARGETAIAIAVRDFGVGMRPGEANIVFNRFWRADPSRARQTGGTGLGLSISLEDARLHGGWLQAWGERDRGAQFRLTLPLFAGQRVTESPLPLVPEDALSAEDVASAQDVTSADATVAPLGGGGRG